jgi:hypothetical protein
VLLLVSASVVTAQTPSTPVSSAGVVPMLYTGGPGGNVTCDQVGTYAFSSPRFSDDVQYGGEYGPINWWTDENGLYVSWGWYYQLYPEGHGGLAVIVKGGTGANVYIYGPASGEMGDSGLGAPPTGRQGRIPKPSNITFCWNPPSPSGQ